MLSKWDRRFLDLASVIAQWSKDQSTKVGSVIVGRRRQIVSTGYNGPPRGVRDDVPERHVRPRKYSFFAHSERNAIDQAAMNGVSPEGCTIYVSAAPALPPCADCARGIIQTGIVRVVMIAPKEVPERWLESCTDAKQMLEEAGVELVEVFDL